MKKALCTMLALALCFSLSAGCAASEPNVSPDPAASSPATSAGSPYALADGQYETDADGFPTGTWEYERPLSTADDVLRFWTVSYSPQYIPGEGFETLPNIAEERARTGVQIEYILINADSRAESMAVMLASDDLADLLAQGLLFLNMTPAQSVEEGYLANLYDYRAYMPNYMYYAANLDANTRSTILSEPESIYAFYALFDKQYTTMGYVAREDWLQQLGMTHADIVTLDDAHEMLTLFKTQIDGCQWPMEIISSVDVVNYFSCFDTQTQVDSTALPSGYIVDGQVVLPHSGPNDFAFLETISQWFSEGLIDANWASYLFSGAYAHNVTGGATGFTFMQPSEIPGFESMTDDPDAEWAPVRSALRQEGQTLHLLYGATNLGYGHTCISARCENIELAVSWCDWRYSPSGSFFSSYGVEGLTWEYDANGHVTATEFALNNPDGMTYATLMNFYMTNFLAEHGMEIYDRKYAFPGGERLQAMHLYWAEVPGDDSYKWPSGVQFTVEQEETLMQYSTDLVTYISENFLAFIDGSKPLSEWETYVEQLYDMGWEEVRAVKQEAYDAFVAQQADI